MIRVGASRTSKHRLMDSSSWNGFFWLVLGSFFALMALAFLLTVSLHFSLSPLGSSSVEGSRDGSVASASFVDPTDHLRQNRRVHYVPQGLVRREVRLPDVQPSSLGDVLLLRPYSYLRSTLYLPQPSDGAAAEHVFDVGRLMKLLSSLHVADAQTRAQDSTSSGPAYRRFDLSEALVSRTQGEDSLNEGLWQSIALGAIANGEGRTLDDWGRVDFFGEALDGGSGTVVGESRERRAVNAIDLSALPALPSLRTASQREVWLDLGADGQLFDLLRGAGVAERNAKALITAFGSAADLRRLGLAWRLRLAMVDRGEAAPVLVYAAGLYEADRLVASVKVNPDRSYSSFLGEDEIFPELHPVLSTENLSDVSLYDAFHTMGAALGLSASLVDRIVALFIYDVDFRLDVSTRDRIELVLDHRLAPSASDEGEDLRRIVYAALTHRGERFAYHFVKDAVTGTQGYFNESGENGQRFLIAKPMAFGTYTSGFGYRIHPITRELRHHDGIDWSAPRGTPIFAAGDGTVLSAYWNSGYGNTVRIAHRNGYSTTYAHLSNFAKGIRKGAKVRMGEKIGEVGSTGLSTGPHLHYEVALNGRSLDPSQIEIPRASVLEPAEFQRFRDRLDALREALSESSGSTERL